MFVDMLEHTFESHSWTQFDCIPYTATIEPHASRTHQTIRKDEREIKQNLTFESHGRSSTAPPIPPRAAGNRHLSLLPCPQLSIWLLLHRIRMHCSTTAAFLVFTSQGAN